ncbi:GrdX family protein [Senegalia massiliensis]|jgi:hypothetical protein|uniref:GrdX family protein n=1 Tax=Senegalia massiliensis TaxID=1720316 RepID=UPI001030CE51|nr:GrdX family protein [Senegalia massiliensis]
MTEYIITNNPLVHKRYNEKFKVDYLKISYIEVLEYVRDKIHLGHKLLTHPLSGSIKPNETPYKSVIISKETNTLDIESLMVIEDSIVTADKFINKIGNRKYDENSLEDFKVVDLSLIGNCIKK